MPQMPDGLNEIERKAWTEVCDWLGTARVLTADNGFALLVLVDALAALWEARESGTPSQRSKARNDLLRACGKFGLTPADRCDVAPVSAAESKNDKSRFFKTK